MFKVIRKSEASVRQIASNKVAINYITKEISPQVSLAITEGKDYSEHEQAKYNRIYFVLDGKLVLQFEGEKVVLSRDDACFIEKTTEYQMSGTVKAIVINQPAFGS